MAVTTILFMFHLIFWFAQGIFLVVANIFFFLLTLFIISSLFSLFNLHNLRPLSFFIQPFILIIFFSQPYAMTGTALLIFSLLIFLLDPTPYITPNVNFWNLMVSNLNTAIWIREILHIPDPTYFFLRRLNFLSFIFISALLSLIFCSSHQIFIIILIFISSTTAILTGLSIGFFFSLISLPFSPYKSPPSPPSPPSLCSPSSIQFARFLNSNIDSHPLDAIMEESFYEDNLQIGDFFIAYPIFFNASLPYSINLTVNEEIISLWHTIRWESAFSNQTGSASSRWSSVFNTNFSSMPSSAHSVHTPLIPIFNEELFYAINEAGLPTFDPFNQPPEWSPYDIVTTFLGWSEEENNEERLVEMEEED